MQLEVEKDLGPLTVQRLDRPRPVFNEQRQAHLHAAHVRLHRAIQILRIGERNVERQEEPTAGLEPRYGRAAHQLMPSSESIIFLNSSSGTAPESMTPLTKNA